MDLMLDPACEYNTFGDALKVGRACDEARYRWLEDPYKDGGLSAVGHRKLRQLILRARSHGAAPGPAQRALPGLRRRVLRRPAIGRRARTRPVPQSPGLGVEIDWDWVARHQTGIVIHE